MNILFVYPNINGDHLDTYSFGLASIVSVAKRDGHTPKVIILKKKADYSIVLAEVEKFRPQLIAFSSVSSQYYFIKEIAALIKTKFRDIIIVCGGIHPTINPYCILETEFLDAIFIGESENSFIEFLKKIDLKKSYKDTDNLAYLEKGKVIINKCKSLITDLDSLPYPDKEIYPYDDTLKTVGFAPFLFSRGCPYLCSYCSNHAIAKIYGLSRNYPRYRSPESSIQEIEEAVCKFSINTISIGDDIFGLNKKWREEFCEKYKKRIKIKFFSILRVDLVNEEFIRLLKDAGCCRITIGIESGNEFVRNKIMNRQMSNGQIIKAFNIIHKYRIETNALNIIGVPGETEEMLLETIKLNRKIKPTSSGINIFYPYKGTKLGDYCFENNLVNEDFYNTFSDERRASVINYPEDYKKRLIDYKENWEILVYPFNFKKRFLKIIRKTLIWKILRKFKAFVISSV